MHVLSLRAYTNMSKDIKLLNKNTVLGSVKRIRKILVISVKTETKFNRPNNIILS